jgi:hypothetical protein
MLKVSSAYPWSEWECYDQGFYRKSPPYFLSKRMCEYEYMLFFKQEGVFKDTISLVQRDWPKSFETFINHMPINKVAWLGQVCVFYATGVPRVFKYSYNSLPIECRRLNNKIAERAINEYRDGNKEIFKEMGGVRLPERYTRLIAKRIGERKSSSFIQEDMLSVIEKRFTPKGIDIEKGLEK